MAVTIQIIKDSVENIDLITHNSDAVITRCLSNATLYVDTIAAEAGRILSDAVRDTIITKRTMYELFIYSQDFQQANEYKEDASIMLNAAIGKNNTGETIAVKTPTAYVVEGRTDWNGY